MCSDPVRRGLQQRWRRNDRAGTTADGRGRRRPGRERAGRECRRRRRDRLDQRLRLVHRRADLHRRRRGARREQPGLQVHDRGPRHGRRLQRFCAGETDISDASRKIKDEEAAICQAAGIEYIELKIAIDGLSILTSVNNTAVTCLQFADLYALIGPESHRLRQLERRRGAREGAGLHHDAPRRRPDDHGPGRGVRHVRQLRRARDRADRGRARPGGARRRPDYTASPNDNAIIEGIGGSDTSLGWVGFAFAEENKDTVGEIEVAEGRQRRRASPRRPRPSPATSTRSSRDLFIYVNKAKAAENPAVAALRRLLPRRRHDRVGPRDRPVREPGARGARRRRAPPGTPAK